MSEIFVNEHGKVLKEEGRYHDDIYYHTLYDPKAENAVEQLTKVLDIARAEGVKRLQGDIKRALGLRS